MLGISKGALCKMRTHESILRRSKTVVIGDTVINKVPGTKPKLIPSKQFDRTPQEIVQHLRWMGQKYNLNQVIVAGGSQHIILHTSYFLMFDIQDMYLSGHPGALRRQIILSFAQVCGMEVEYLPISRDTTESDIKQRKEIKGNSN